MEEARRPGVGRRSGGRWGPAAFALASMALLGSAPLHAQWHIDAQAGRLQYEVAPEAASTSLGLGVGYTGRRSDAGLSVGMPLSPDEPVWGALYGAHRVITEGRTGFGIDVAASGFAYRLEQADSSTVLPGLPTRSEALLGWGLSVEAMPLVAWQGSRMSAEARAGAVHFTTRANEGAGYDRTAFASDVSLAAAPAFALRVRLDGRWVQVTEGGFPYAGIGVTWSPGVTLWGTAGRWLRDDAGGTAWSAGALLPLGERLSIRVSGRHDQRDPVYATPARTTWGAGITFLLGDDPASHAEPVPADYRGGIATIALDDDAVDGTPSIAGDFNEWTPEPMIRRGGEWTYQAEIAPGVYHYAFVDEQGEWFVPRGTPGRRDDGMGGHVAVLVVEP